MGFALTLATVSAGLLNPTPTLAHTPAKSSVAVEPKGDCYTFQFTHDASVEVNDESNWQGPSSVNISECAALAGAQIENASDPNAVGLGRWDALELHANADGSYDVVQNGETKAHRFWDTEARVKAATEDIDAFWQREFDARDWRYQSPRRVQSYSTRIRTACGRAPKGNAFFCQSSNSIYYDLDLLNEARDQIGDFAPATIIAHEWGHAIQSQRNLFRRSNSTMKMELQADCFAGAYTQDASTRGFLDNGDEQEAKDLFSRITGSRRSSDRTHGTAKQRMAAFSTGLDGGVDACLGML